MANAEPLPQMSNRALIGRVAKTYVAPRTAGYLASMACAAISVSLAASLAWLIKLATDNGMVRGDLAYIAPICGLMIVVGVGKALFSVLQARMVNRMGHGVVGDAQVDLFRRLIHADLSRIRAAHSGAFVSSVLYDATLMREAATNGVINYVQQGLTLIAMATYMAILDWKLMLGTLTIGPLAFAVIRRFSGRTVRAVKGAMSESASLSTAIMEGLDGVRIVKIENREAYEESRVKAVIDRRQRFLVKGANARSTSPPITESLMVVLLAGVIYYVTWQAHNGRTSVGAFLSFIYALNAAGQAVRQLASLQNTMAEGMAASRRLFAAMDVQQEIGDRDDAGPLAEPAREIRFDHVSFEYAPDAPALEDVSLSVSRGETVALVGPSGGGKSTILNLIPRFYDVVSGRVLIDGRDVRDVTLKSLREQIGLVTQEPFLFDDSIRANIAYARDGASEDEIVAAATAAAAHDFIEALPNGYDTQVGEAGLRLSGGQRQRIAIARAFLKNAPILLLDEATSALDTESEQLVQAALNRLMAGRATIVIAHRLSTVRDATRIYVIDGGRIVETGAHAKLIRARGLYARLAAAQNLDAKPEAAE
ncbi:MAG TPA: ABC transporter ATP-binding protein [Caulobacteraceae bacterium]|nr:ABC transporter ATP-binding protein [Caulobacteraceae bacterium]